jgi:hypothetical protein
MPAMQISMPRTAPAQAAVADGVHRSLAPVGLRPEAALNVEYRCGFEQTPNWIDAPRMGSEGVAVA